MLLHVPRSFSRHCFFSARDDVRHLRILMCAVFVSSGKTIEAKHKLINPHARTCAFILSLEINAGLSENEFGKGEWGCARREWGSGGMIWVRARVVFEKECALWQIFSTFLRFWLDKGAKRVYFIWYRFEKEPVFSSKQIQAGDGAGSAVRRIFEKSSESGLTKRRNVLY